MGLIRSLSQNLKACRIKIGITQQQLADKSGLDVRYISRLETNPQNIKLDKVEVLAKALKVTVCELVCEQESPKAENLAEIVEDTIKNLRILKAKLQ